MIDDLSQPLDEFKERELEILGLMAAGHSNQEIADRLFISKETVRWYNKQVYSKLGTSRRTEAVALARQFGLIGEDGQTPPSAARGRNTLPATTGPFVGRDDDLAQLSELLRNQDVRLITIIAAGGMGKSRLALELGWSSTDDYEHGAAFVDLAPIRDPDDVARAALLALGLPGSNRQTPEQILVDYCHDKSLLLIFDNFEHVLKGAPVLSRLLAAAPGVMIIATSRERLNLRVETAYHLRPVADEPGVQLFLEVARTMHPTVTVADEELPAVQRTVMLVGGLPLALILAATWIDTLSIAAIADEIGANLSFLTAETGDVPDRQQSMHAVIDPTWQRLSVDERAAFMRASVFRGGFTRQLFQAVAGASIRTLQTLLNRSLITRRRGHRFDMHPLLLQYAQEKLEADGGTHDARQAHLNTMLTYARANKARMRGEAYFDALTNLVAEEDNLRAALDWSLAGNAPDNGITLVKTLGNFWIVRSQVQDALRYLDLALQFRQDDPELLTNSSFCLYRLGRLAEAEKRARTGIAMAEKAESPRYLASGYRNLALLTANDSHAEETRLLLEKALAFAEASGSWSAISAVRTTLTIHLRLTGAPVEALIEQYQQVLTTWEAIGDVMEISHATYNLGILYFGQGNTRRARELFEHSLELKRRLRDRAGIARRLAVLATYDILDEEFQRARRYLEESREICAALGEPARMQYTLFIEGYLFMITGEYARSQKVLQESLQVATRLRMSQRIGECETMLGLLHLNQGDPGNAWPHIWAAVEALQDTGQPPWYPLIAYANFLWHKGDVAACLRIVVVLDQAHAQAQRAEPLRDRYLLRPLIYGVRQHIGDAAWQAAATAAADVTLETVFADVAEEIVRET